jgi:MoaA/NifB/PqqE/SkfB family radical SAM enzyme
MSTPLALRLAAAALDRDRVLLANLVITRRCNLSCGYCFEYDHTSDPVPTAVLKARLDHLARLRTVFVTLTGGESLLHPDVVALVAYVRELGMIPLLNTNGFLLTAEVIAALGDAGLYGMQLSIDAVRPNQVTKKSLKTLRPKLALLAAHARFPVRINTVLGAGSPDEVLEVARAALAYGFAPKVSLARDAAGALIPLDDRARAAYDEFRRLDAATPRYLREDFYQVPLLRDGELDWKCRAGARFFHVTVDGLVENCPSNPGARVPLLDLTVADLRRAFAAPKACAATCTQSYAHQASRLDALRGQRGPAQLTYRDARGRVALAVVR